MIRCKLCGRTFETFSDLFFHIKRECKNFPHTRRCPVCGTRFKTIRLLKFHLVNSALTDPQHRNYIAVMA